MLSVKNSLEFSLLNDPSACPVEWDDLVARLEFGHVFQSRMWAQYKQKVGWRPFLLSWANNESLKAVCLLLHRSIAGLPFGGILYAPRGPVLDYASPEAPHIFSEILARLVHFARLRCSVVRVSPDVEHSVTWVTDKLSEMGFRKAKQPVQHTTTLRLSLEAEIPEIIGRMEKGRRYWVRRFEKNGDGWLFDDDNSAKSLANFHHMYTQSMARAAGDPKSLDDMAVMHDTLAPLSHSFVFIARYKGRPVAGAEIVGIGERLWYLYGGSAKEDNVPGGGGVFLHWQIIKWAKEHGYVEYDLQGIPDELNTNNPLHGVYLFKRGWGGKKIRLIGEYDYSPYPFLGKILNWKISRLGD